jgi:hypothetical protein
MSSKDKVIVLEKGLSLRIKKYFRLSHKSQVYDAKSRYTYSRTYIIQRPPDLDQDFEFSVFPIIRVISFLHNKIKHNYISSKIYNSDRQMSEIND